MSRLVEQFEAHAARNPEAMAIAGGALALSYGDLRDQSADLARWLLAQGLSQGDRIGVIKRSMGMVYLSALAGARAGIAIAPMDFEENETKLRHVFETAEVGMILVEDEALLAVVPQGMNMPVISLDQVDLTAMGRDPLPDPDPNAIWSIEPTSGSSGTPKLVPLSLRDLDHYIELQAGLARLSPDDVTALFGEMWFDCLFSNLWAGAQMREFDLRRMGSTGLDEWMREQGVTAFQSFPVALRALSEVASGRFPRLRLVRLAGEALLPRDVAEFKRLCPDNAVMSNFYGSTECGLFTNFDLRATDAMPDGPMPAGFPPIPDEVRIEDEAGNTLPEGVPGVVAKRAPFLAMGYLNNPAQTEGVYWQEGAIRVLRTGDLGYFDSDGCLHLIGRADDMVKIRGYSVKTSEVEAELSGDGHFREIVVTSWLSPTGTRQLVCHYVLNKPGLDTRAYRKTLMERLPAYMVPVYFIAHDHLPKTETGKVKRRALPEPGGGGATAAVFEGTEKLVADCWVEILGHGGFGAEDDFFDVGGESLQAMSMLVRLEQVMHRRLGFETLVLHGATVRAIAARLDSDDWDPFVTLNEGDRGATPVYVMPVENGEFSDWLYYMNALRGGHRYLGVHVRDPLQRRGFRRSSVAERAAVAADAIMRADGSGHYRIAGFSAGTFTAIETARILKAQGAARVELILIEPYPARFLSDHGSWWWRRIISPLIKRRAPMKMLRRAGHILFGAPIDELPIADEVLYRRYEPTPFTPDRALMVSCTEENPHQAENETLWRSMVAGLVIIHAPDNHTHVIRDPNAPALAQRVEAWIGSGSEKT